MFDEMYQRNVVSRNVLLASLSTCLLDVTTPVLQMLKSNSCLMEQYYANDQNVWLLADYSKMWIAKMCRLRCMSGHTIKDIIQNKDIKKVL